MESKIMKPSASDADTLLSRVRVVRPELRRSEQKVADFVLARPSEVVNSSITVLADRTQVSEPTIIRFCRALGCGGFQDFKLRLAGSLARGVPYVYTGVDASDSTADVGKKVFDRSIATLIEVRNHLDPRAFERAIDLLKGAKRIEFYGHGASGIVASDAQHKFFRLGTPAVAYSDPHIHSMSAATLDPGCVVVAISHTGRSVDLLNSVDTALDTGADVIAITAWNSPLAHASTVALFADVAEDTDCYTPMMSRITHLVMVDVLAVGVALRRGPELVEQLEGMKRNLLDKRLGELDNEDTLSARRRRGKPKGDHTGP